MRRMTQFPERLLGTASSSPRRDSPSTGAFGVSPDQGCEGQTAAHGWGQQHVSSFTNPGCTFWVMCRRQEAKPQTGRGIWRGAWVLLCLQNGSGLVSAVVVHLKRRCYAHLVLCWGIRRQLMEGDSGCRHLVFRGQVVSTSPHPGQEAGSWLGRWTLPMAGESTGFVQSPRCPRKPLTAAPKGWGARASPPRHLSWWFWAECS